MNRRQFLKSIPFFAVIPTFEIRELKPNLESLIHRDYRSQDLIAKNNNQYLLDNLDEKTKKTLANPERVRSKVISQLIKLKHIDYELVRNISFAHTFKDEEVRHRGHFDVHYLSFRQLARVYLFLETLKLDKFRNEIGGELLDDLEDLQVNRGFLPSERGGLIKYSNGEVSLYPVESLDAKKPYSPSNASISNITYTMDSKILTNTPHILWYHTHASVEDNYKYSGPSISVMKNKKLVGSDMIHLREKVLKEGEAHHIVFSKLTQNRFNVCFYSGELKLNKPDYVVLSLGNWPHEELVKG